VPRLPSLAAAWNAPSLTPQLVSLLSAQASWAVKQVAATINCFVADA
jgi:hypothetical protein